MSSAVTSGALSTTLRMAALMCRGGAGQAALALARSGSGEPESGAISEPPGPWAR